MKTKIKRRLFIFLSPLSLLFWLILPTYANSLNQSYILATATTGGTYYPVGVAIATLTKIKLQPKHHISLSAISSAGSGENIKLLRENQAQFAILQGLYGAWAWHGEGHLKQQGAQSQLRAITLLWQNVEHFIIQKKMQTTGTMDDLKHFAKHRFSLGKRNSGTEGSGRHILNALGIHPDQQFNVVYMGYGQSTNALLNQKIRGMNSPAGIPVSAVSHAFATRGDELTILNFTPQHISKINIPYPLWTKYTIPANTYPKQTQPVQTIAQPNFLAVNQSIDENTVYLITKTLYENLTFLSQIHKATQAMSLNNAIKGLPVPLHPGAARYYKEQGIEIP